MSDFTAPLAEAQAQDDPHGFGSHLRILKMVLGLVKPLRVLELGAGWFSTPEFLKCDSVAEVTSLETDGEWAERVKEAIDDPRLKLRLVDDVAAEVSRLKLTDFNLIFVDNGQSVGERVEGIRSVLKRQDRPPVVIHDAEYPDYRMVISQLAGEHIVFDHPQHHTAVVW